MSRLEKNTNQRILFATLFSTLLFGFVGTVQGEPEELLIVRGYNGANFCDATIIGTGNSPTVKPQETLTNLSVNCGSSKNVTYKELRALLPNDHACITYLRKLRDQNNLTQIVKDPLPNNKYHCLLSELTPKQFVSGSKWQN